MRFRHMTSVYLRRDGRLLLLYRTGSRVVNNQWIGTAGGHFEPSELNDPTACVLRELQEETGLTAGHIEHLALRYVTLRRKNGEIRQNHYFFADLKPGIGEPASTEGRLQWFSEAELSGLDMPHSARYMLEHWLAVGRYDDRLYGGVSRADGVDFHELNEF